MDWLDDAVGIGCEERIKVMQADVGPFFVLLTGTGSRALTSVRQYFHDKREVPAYLLLIALLLFVA